MIELKKLTKKFKQTIAVDNISFEINSGEVFERIVTTLG